jgi:hypothetical protein
MMQRLLVLFAMFSIGFGPMLALAPRAEAAVLHRPGQRPGADDKTLVIYPNPSTGIIHLTINNLEGKKVELSVLNVIGSVMYRETLTELNERYTKTLDLSKFANGLYYVKLDSPNNSQMCKLVIR